MCVCLCTDSAGIAWNELICGYANIVHTSYSAHTHTHTYTHTHTHTLTHTHILIPFKDHELTGLKVDIAVGLGIVSLLPHLLGP